MRQKTTTVFLLLSLVLASCSEELSKGSGDDGSAVKTLTLPQVTSTLDGLPEANTYRVTIQWPVAEGTVRISLNSKILAVVAGHDQKFVHGKVQGGSELSYLIEQLTSDGRVLSSVPLFVHVPRDYVFPEKLVLTEHLRVETPRVFFRENTKITTLNFNLTVIANHLIASGAVIENFEESTKAPREQNGRSGGNIQLMSKSAEGTLQVILRGEAGGTGRDGVITFPGRHPGCAGSSGGNGGNSGNLSANFDDGLEFTLTVQNYEGKKGVRGERGSVPYTTPRSDAIHPPCVADAPDGRDGASGFKGQACIKLSQGQSYGCQ